MARTKRNWKCPECLNIVNPEKLYQHTRICEKWIQKFGDTFPKFLYSLNAERILLFEGDKRENVDYIQCKACMEFGLDFRFSLLTQHIKAHNLTEKEYMEKYPTSKIRLDKTTERRVKTSIEIYGVENVSQLEESKEKAKQTTLRNYGSENIWEVPEIREKIHNTNMKLYGVKNPFESPDFQKLARDRMVEIYGAPNAAQVPEIVARRKETCLEKYSAPSALQSKEYLAKVHEGTLQRKQERREALIKNGTYEICHFCNEVYTKITSRHKAICEGWPDKPIIYPCLCGHESTSNTQMRRHKDVCEMWISRDRDKVQRERFLNTLQLNYGEQYTSPFQIPEIREKIRETCRKVYGVDWASMSKEVQDKMMATCLERYGVPYSGQLKEAHEKSKQTNLEKYGSENPFGSIEIQEKVLRTCLGQIGLEFMEYEFPAKSKQDLIERYGIQYPMQNKDYAFKVLQKQHTENGPNGFESKILSLCPQLIYTGNSAWWRWLPKLGRHKNPDFLVPGPDPEFPRRWVTQVIEAHGDFWHSERFTGKPNHIHEQEVIEAYEDIGIQCLVIWENEVNQDLEAVRKRIEEFVGNC